MKHEKLDAHTVIAWDMDKTLIDGPNSTFFRNYIIANPHKHHHVVTFRDTKWASRIMSELAAHDVPSHLIKAVHNCPDHLYFAFATNTNQSSIARFLRWKGLMAKKIGATVLVDDVEDWVIQGCIEHDVVFVNALCSSFGHHDLVLSKSIDK